MDKKTKNILLIVIMIVMIICSYFTVNRLRYKEMPNNDFNQLKLTDNTPNNNENQIDEPIEDNSQNDNDKNSINNNDGNNIRKENRPSKKDFNSDRFNRKNDFSKMQMENHRERNNDLLF